MNADRQSQTLLLTRLQGAPTATGAPTRDLSTDILSQSARRLRVLALLYSFTFFMSGSVNLVSAEGRAQLWAEFVYWIPDTLAILLGLVVAGFTLSRRVPIRTAVKVGLVFIVASSYGIAIAEFLNPVRLDNNGWIGLSWVAVWTLLGTVLIPARPRTTLFIALASVSSVPIVIGTMILSGRTIFQPDAFQFFSYVVLPYLLVVVLAYACQRVVYALGKEATRAKELGSYRLIERIGQGGMGEVWRADHLMLARPAAIKLLRPSLIAQQAAAASSALRRFEREAQVTAGLRSPHTVELWDFGVTAEGALYYVMELLDGLNLETLVKRHGPVPAERAVYLLRQVCRSLAEAEAKGLVHRDIKPANIFVCHYGAEYDFVKVLDFGIAKWTQSAQPGVMVTHETVVQGTPAFIAPEQALGGAEIDGRADIYAAGCVAYWLLTGELVFTADTAMGVLMHHANTRPTPPSQRSELPIPPALDALILSCLAKDPADRPQTAPELARRLAESARPGAWNDDLAREWWARHEPAA